jgi:heat-inducible transcriptional repressor
MSEDALPYEDRQTIRHQFHQTERAMEQWFQLAAAVLAHQVSNFAVVTSPRSSETRLRHVQLVPLQELSVLCVVVLNEARIRQQVLALREPVEENELVTVAASVNERYAGLTPQQAILLPEPASELQGLVVKAVVELMDQESVALGDVFRDGVREVLSQPEFARSERMLDIIDILEQRTLPNAIPIRQLGAEGISVVIGGENTHESLRECSVVVARYGIEGGPSGVVAVLGPTRMRYSRTIPTVRYLATLLGEMMQQI